MELKAGYKQTDVGVIPEDWASSEIGNHCFVTKLAGFEYTLHFDYSIGGSIIAIRGLNIQGGHLDLTDVHTIPKKTSDALPRSKLRKGDLVMSYVGTIGRVAIIPQDGIFHLAPNVAKVTVERESVSAEFLTHFLNSFEGQSVIQEAAASTTQAALSMKNLRRLPFPLPPTKAEQAAIARALSDADALIESLEELIAKKRQIRQGAMQELLTPKQGWKPMKLGDLLAFKNGLNKSKEFFGYGEPIVNYMDVFQSPVLTPEKIQGRVSLSTKERANFNVRNGDVFFTRTSETPEEVGMAAVMIGDPNETVFSGFVLRARPRNSDLSSLYAAYALRSTVVRDQIVSKASYTTRALTNGRILSEVDFALPSMPEQSAIAEILSEMDTEIAALGTRLSKARQVKQGMMQELLTGRIRLI